MGYMKPRRLLYDRWGEDKISQIDSSLNDRWPQSFGSRVYPLCETIINQTRLS